jgi:hypothetical protein
MRRISEKEYRERFGSPDDPKAHLNNPATVCLASYARLLELEARRWTRDGRLVELDPADERDYHRLKQWWNAWEGKRFNLMDLAKELSRNVENWAHLY